MKLIFFLLAAFLFWRGNGRDGFAAKLWLGCLLLVTIQSLTLLTTFVQFLWSAAQP